MSSLRRLFVLVLAVFAAGGCVTMRPYAEVAAALPPESLVAVDGRRVHVVDRGEGEPLLLLHGFGASTLIWDPVLPELAARRRVVAIDLNGFGWTERPREREAYTLAGQERLVLGVADALGLDRFDLAGHSYGGAISLFLAARHPERVRSLVLVDSAMPAYGTLRRRRRFANRLLAGFYVRTVGLTARRVREGLEASYADDAKVTEDLTRAYLERLRIEGVEDAFYGLTAPTGAPPDEVDLGSLAVPTLLVWGAEDELISVDDARRLAAKMPAAELVALPGCGHSPQEECPREFVAAVAPFLAAREPERPQRTGGGSS
jgi:pimeloyl-ACP methyl ester carboxylesterase